MKEYLSRVVIELDKKHTQYVLNEIQKIQSFLRQYRNSQFKSLFIEYSTKNYFVLEINANDTLLMSILEEYFLQKIKKQIKISSSSCLLNRRKNALSD